MDQKLTEGLINLDLTNTPNAQCKFIQENNLTKSSCNAYPGIPVFYLRGEPRTAEAPQDKQLRYTISEENKKIVMAIDDLHQKVGHLENSSPKAYPKIICPKDAEFENVYDALFLQKMKAKNFFEQFEEKSFNVHNHVGGIFNKALEIKAFMLSIEGFKGRIQLNTIPISYPTLEDELEIKIYLRPLILHTADIWKNTKCCEECSKIFFYKLARARFCSEACRLKAKRRREKEKNLST